MLREVTITFLEMTSPRQLVPGRTPPEPLGFERAGSGDLERFRSAYLQVGAPYGWTARPAWSTRQWQERLERADVVPWLAVARGDVAGVVELELGPDGAVELAVFGLLSEFVGRGLGGHLLTVATRVSWAALHGDGSRTSKVWLHTSSYDHPHAITNYEARGFRIVRREHRRHEVDPAVEAAAGRTFR